MAKSAPMVAVESVKGDDGEPWPSLEAEIQDSNDRYAGAIEIRHTEGDDDNDTNGGRGWGLFAVKPFLPEQLVMASRATDLPGQTLHSVQVGWDRHVHMDLPARFVNHACPDGANVGIRLNTNEPTPSYDYYALRDIDAGEELLWDYECSEYEIQNFACRCGAAKCRGKLKGFKHHKDDVLKAYGGNYIAPYLVKGARPLNGK